MSFISHINESGNIQTVREHCEQVAVYAEENGRSFGMPNTMFLVGLLHDMGKSTRLFDSYIRRAVAGENVRRGEVNHSTGGARYVLHYCDDDLVLRELMAYAISAHHGVFDELSPEGKNLFSRRVDHPRQEIRYEEALEASAEWIQAERVKKYFSEAAAETQDLCSNIRKTAEEMRALRCKSVPDKTKGDALFVDNTYCLLSNMQRLILSALMDADRRDTAEFMSGNKRVRPGEKELQALWSRYENILDEKQASFRDDTPINKFRREMSDQCAAFAERGDGIYRLSIPTGGGKTLSGMRYAVKLARRTCKKHVIYVAPFLSILEQNAKTYRELFQDDEHILEHHSNIIWENLDTPEQRESLERWELLADDWSAPVILTTMVRFMNVLYGSSTQDIRRMTALCDSVIILDEAQSIPVKTIDLINTALNFLARQCNSTIVLCTATQPLFEATVHPLLLSDEPDMISDQRKYEKGFERVKAVNAISQEGFDTEKLADFILKHFTGNMLVILNTKAAVRHLCDALKNRIEPNVRLMQLTTYMCAAHREDKIDELRELLKKGQLVLCISTQLIEAGVDISFEAVVRSAAGLDNITQAAGRCNRNGEKKGGLGSVYVVDYREENLDMLEDIRLAKEAFLGVLDTYDGELLSQGAMKQYYLRYFFKRLDQMAYPVKNLNTTIYDLLSLNMKSRREYERSCAEKYPFPMAESFETAYRAFHSIETLGQQGLIVHYGESNGLIRQLEESYSDWEKLQIVKRLQRYTVNINARSKLVRSLFERNAVSEELDGSILILSPAYYDETGVVDTPGLECY